MLNRIRMLIGIQNKYIVMYTSFKNIYYKKLRGIYDSYSNLKL